MRRRATSGPLRSWFDTAVDLVLPGGCVGCSAPGAALCRSCLGSARGPVIRANRGLRVGPLPPCVASAAYADPIRVALVGFKDRGRRELSTSLGGLLARAVAGVLDLSTPATAVQPVALVPIPSARSAARSRGGDHVHRLARVAAAALAGAGVRATVVPLLASIRPVRDSVGLGPQARIANLEGAFGLRVSAAAARDLGLCPTVVLVDDIVTTGATLAEAVAVLRMADIEVAGCAVVACVTRTEWSNRVQIGGVRG